MNNKGILINSTIRPQHSGDTFAIVYSNEIKGGHHQVNNIIERNSISMDRRIEGMFCSIVSGTTGTTYQLIGGIDNTNWVEFITTSGSTESKLSTNLKNLQALNTSGTTNGYGKKCCNTPLPSNKSDSLVQVFLNGISVPCGNNSSDYCFFAPDDGSETLYSNARSQGEQQKNDILYWREDADYQIETDDIFDFVLLI
jgi:hypothetical protein